jgi:hypothetical protein
MELLSRDWEVYLTHTLREVNSHADFLAKHVAQNLSEFCIWKDSPSRLNALMLVDSSYGYLLSLKSDLVYSYFSTVPKKNVRTRLNLCIRSWNVRSPILSLIITVHAFDLLTRLRMRTKTFVGVRRNRSNKESLSFILSFSWCTHLVFKLEHSRMNVPISRR